MKTLLNNTKQHMRAHMEAGGITGIVMAIAFAALAFVVAGLVLSYSALVNVNVATGLSTNCSAPEGCTAALINGNTTSGLNTFGTNMPTVAQVIVAVLIITLLFYGFGALITRGSGGQV